MRRVAVSRTIARACRRTASRLPTVGYGAAVLADLNVCITTSDTCTSSASQWATLIPVFVGAVLGYLASTLGRRSERSWQTKRDEYASQTLVVKPLDEALVLAQMRIQNVDVPDGESRWAAAHRAWEDGRVRLTPHLTDGELEARYHAVGTILKELEDHDSMGTEIPRSAMVTVAMRAIANARCALAYWMRGDPLPPRSFPDSQKTLELLGQGDPQPLAADAPLRTWLREHEQPPWRPAPPPWWKRLLRRT